VLSLKCFDASSRYSCINDRLIPSRGAAFAKAVDKIASQIYMLSVASTWCLLQGSCTAEYHHNSPLSAICLRSSVASMIACVLSLPWAMCLSMSVDRLAWTLSLASPGPASPSGLLGTAPVILQEFATYFPLLHHAACLRPAFCKPSQGRRGFLDPTK